MGLALQGWYKVYYGHRNELHPDCTNTILLVILCSVFTQLKFSYDCMWIQHSSKQEITEKRTETNTCVEVLYLGGDLRMHKRGSRRCYHGRVRN